MLPNHSSYSGYSSSDNDKPIRNKKDIYKFLDELGVLWLAYPHLNVMELITGTHVLLNSTVVVLEDEITMKIVSNAYERHSKRNEIATEGIGP